MNIAKTKEQIAAMPDERMTYSCVETMDTHISDLKVLADSHTEQEEKLKKFERFVWRWHREMSIEFTHKDLKDDHLWHDCLELLGITPEDEPEEEKPDTWLVVY